MKAGHHYKNGEKMHVDDSVKISKKVAEEHKVTQFGTITSLVGFITVRLSNGTEIDLDARQVFPKE